MEDEYVDSQDSVMNEVRNSDNSEGVDSQKDFGEQSYDDGYDDEEVANSFRGGPGRGNFNRNRGRGPPPGWMNGPPPPMRFRGRGYGPGGPPMRGRGFFRGRGGPRGFGPNNGPNFDNNWGPMGPPPPGMMGGPPPFGPPPGMMPGGPMGPPPNMMGQPPPFGGPPGMPPPNMPGPELWVEVKTEEGKSYYYHARSKETTWTRPQEGPACKVITQGDMEAMAAGQMQGMGGPPMSCGPMMGPMAMNGMPPGLPPYMSQPPPWVKESMGKDKLECNSPSEQDDLPPGDVASLPTNANGTMMQYQDQSGTNNSNTVANMSQPPNMGQGMGQNNMGNVGPPPNMGQGGPGFGAWGGWGGWPPPMAHGPPAMATMPNAGAAAQIPSTLPTPDLNKDVSMKDDKLIPPELLAQASEWTTHTSPDGRPYYYNANKQESVWEKPQPMKELEELQMKMAADKAEKTQIKKVDQNEVDDLKGDVVDVEAHAEAAMAAAEAERVEKEKQRIEQEKKDKEKQQEKKKLVSTTPISGTPWCVVWTDDGDVFYHNPSTRASVRARPEALIGLADVDRAISRPPMALLRAHERKLSDGAVATTPAGNGELKRSADSDSEDSDAEPPKKSKPEEAVVATRALGRGCTAEAEARAALERTLVPLEQRLRQFRLMLHEREVSAFSTWEKELHKIVYDKRYLLLTSDDRKRVFNKYVRERAEEERKEKKNRLIQKKEAFRALMEEAKLTSKSSFTDLSAKYAKDERFTGIEKPRDRQTYFNEYIADVRRKEKEEKEKKREQVKTEFIALLKEKGVDRHARWSELRKKLDSEARYKAVDSSSLKEDYFREYCKLIKDERKKEKDRDRSSKKEKKDKDRDKDKEKEKDKDKKEEKEGREAKKEKKKDKSESLETSTEEGASDESLARTKAARAQASIKEREREVHKALATSLRDRDKEREHHKRGEAVQHFNALLADLVRNPELVWREAKKQLKKDHRYSLAELLSKEDKERLFTQHTNTLSSKRRDKLRTLLTDINVSCTATWKEVKATLASDPRTPTYASSQQMEREFRDYQRDRQSSAKTALRQLLLETRAITHKTLAAVKNNHQLLDDLLKHDARYLALEHIPEEREAIVLQYLQELEKKGPPPPPTATEPTRRAKQ